MANNKIQLKRTSVSGRTPNTTNSSNTQYLDTGELALNLTDGKLFSSNGTSLFEIGANLTSLSVGSIVANNTTGSAGQVLTSNGTGIYWATSAGGGGFSNGQSIEVSNLAITGAVTANSSNGSSGQVLTSNGTGVYWSTVSGGGSSFTTYVDSFSGNGSANTFTLAVTPISQEYTSVYVGGVYQSKNTYSLSGSNVIFTEAPANNEPVEITSFSGTGIKGDKGNSGDTSLVLTEQLFTANGTSNTFVLSQSSNSTTALVFVDGLAQIYTEDYTISNTDLTFTYTPSSNSSVQVIYLLGLVGPTGSTGQKGDKGEPDGPKGDKGDTGIAGDKGDKGESVTTGKSIAMAIVFGG